MSAPQFRPFSHRPAILMASLGTLLAGGLGPAAGLNAAPIAVTNHGFEDISGETPFNEFTFGPLNGWNLYDPGGIAGSGAGPTFWVGTLTPFQPDPVGNPGVYEYFPAGAPEGQRVAIAFNFEGSGNTGPYGLQQTLAATLQPLTQYTLTVDIGNIATGVGIDGNTFPLDGFPGYRVDLLAGGVVIASDNNTLAGSIAEGAWGTSVVSFSTGAAHAQSGQALGIRLVNLNLIDPLHPNSDLEVDFDNVRLDGSPVPEPATMLAAAAVGIAVTMMRKRRKRVATGTA